MYLCFDIQWPQEKNVQHVDLLNHNESYRANINLDKNFAVQ